MNDVESFALEAKRVTFGPLMLLLRLCKAAVAVNVGLLACDSSISAWEMVLAVTCCSRAGLSPPAALSTRLVSRSISDVFETVFFRGAATSGFFMDLSCPEYAVDVLVFFDTASCSARPSVR